jgi:hypothetical protein
LFAFTGHDHRGHAARLTEVDQPERKRTGK